jgi:uridine phosphorylase
MTLLHLLQEQPGEIGRYVLLPGDPARCDRIAAHFDQPRVVASLREYRAISGALLGEQVSVVSTGIGSPGAAIAIEDLIALGVDTFIRVGTSGGMQPHLRAGDLGIITAAIRDEGTTKQYLPVEFPAVAHLGVVTALKEAAEKLGYRYHLGVAHSKDSFYGQVQPERMPVARWLIDRWEAWKTGGTICAEMESAILFILSSIHRVRAGSILHIAVNQEGPDPEHVVADHAAAIQTAVEALRILIEQDRAVGQNPSRLL